MFKKGDSTFKCKNCGAKYKARYTDYPERDRGSFNCERCGNEVHSWKGTRDYHDWELLE